jgi:hypothetical protein
MSTTRWGEQPSLLLDELKEALNECSSLSVRMRFAAHEIFVWRSVDLELEILSLAARTCDDDH